MTKQEAKSDRRDVGKEQEGEEPAWFPLVWPEIAGTPVYVSTHSVDTVFGRELFSLLYHP